MTSSPPPPPPPPSHSIPIQLTPAADDRQTLRTHGSSSSVASLNPRPKLTKARSRGRSSSQLSMAPPHQDSNPAMLSPPLERSHATISEHAETRPRSSLDTKPPIRRNRPASKSVSAAAAPAIYAAKSNPDRFHAIRQTNPVAAAAFDQGSHKRFQLGDVNLSSTGSTPTTRSRSTSIAKSTELNEIHSRHTRPTPSSFQSPQQSLVGESPATSPLAINKRIGLKRRISAPNVRVGGASVGAAAGALPRINNESSSNSLGITSMDREPKSLAQPPSSASWRQFPRYTQSPLLNAQILEEPPAWSGSSGNETDQALQDTMVDPAGLSPLPPLSTTSSYRPRRSSTSTLEDEAGSSVTLDVSINYPPTPRTNTLDSVDLNQDKVPTSTVHAVGDLLASWGKAVGFPFGFQPHIQGEEDADAALLGDASRHPSSSKRSWVAASLVRGGRRRNSDTDSELGLKSRDNSDEEDAGTQFTKSFKAHSPFMNSVSGGNQMPLRAQLAPAGSQSYFHLATAPSSSSSSSQYRNHPNNDVDDYQTVWSTNETLPTPNLSHVSLSGGGGSSAATGRSSDYSIPNNRSLRGHYHETNTLSASLWQARDYLLRPFMTTATSRSTGPVRSSASLGHPSSPSAKADASRGRSDSLFNLDGNTMTTARADGSNVVVVGMGPAFKQVVAELAWTLLGIGAVFVVSAGMVAWSVKSLPIASLRSLPTQVSDLQILSAEIREYMASSSSGWWHTVGVLMLTGMWKHSWSIPGALILNILVGSILKPFPAVILLTLITSFGSLGAYLLSRPLAPLIALVFPKPLAIVRWALQGHSNTTTSTDGYQPLSTGHHQRRGGGGGQQDESSVWRRLLVMRAMGLVPWSGMNVACGVVGVGWLTFLLSTAAGSASWSYATASVGDILSQLALPTDFANGHESDGRGGQTIASLVKDPALIAKLVVLSLISLIPVLFKSRSDPINTAPPSSLVEETELEYRHPHISTNAQAMTPIAPTASFWQVVYLSHNLGRKVTRLASSGVRALVEVVTGTNPTAGSGGGVNHRSEPTHVL